VYQKHIRLLWLPSNLKQIVQLRTENYAVQFLSDYDCDTIAENISLIM
jgi:hypothetical protein